MGDVEGGGEGDGRGCEGEGGEDCCFEGGHFFFRFFGGVCCMRYIKGVGGWFAFREAEKERMSEQVNE